MFIYWLFLIFSLEFMRIVSTDLHQSFFDGLDKYAPRLLQTYRLRTSSSSDLRSLLEPLDVEVRMILYSITIPLSLVELVNHCQILSGQKLLSGMQTSLHSFCTFASKIGYLLWFEKGPFLFNFNFCVLKLQTRRDEQLLCLDSHST